MHAAVASSLLVKRPDSRLVLMPKGDVQEERGRGLEANHEFLPSPCTVCID